jgi:hypothetical protein
MATKTEAVNWLNSQVGKYVDFDGAWGSQCTDLFNFYYQQLVGRSPYADGYGVPGAKDLWNVATSRFTKIPDSPTLVPQPGDILIYGNTWGGGYGHVEMVVGVDANGCSIVGANLSGNSSVGVQKTYRSWGGMRGLTGVMRFNFNTAPAVTGEVMNDDTARQIGYHFLGRNGFDGKGNALASAQADLQGQPLTNAKMTEIFLSAESRAWRDAKLPQVFTERDALRNENASLKANLTAVQTALANEQAKPPKEVVKTVTEIVKEYVDRPVPVEVIKEVEPKWLVSVRDAILGFLRLKK